MNKKDLPWIILFGILLLTWPQIDRRFIAPHFRRPAPPPAAEEPARDSVTEPRLTDSASTERPAPGLQPADAEAREPADETPEKILRLANDKVEFAFTTRGAALQSARLIRFTETREPDSPPVTLDFTDHPAMAYSGLPGLGTDFAFDVQLLENENGIRFERRTASGIRLARTVTLDDGYLLRVTDLFSNESGVAQALRAHSLRLGQLSGRKGEPGSNLGVDTLSPGDDKVTHWGRQFDQYIRPEYRGGPLPESAERFLPEDGRRLDWAALKEKFFVLILTPEGGAESVRTRVRREILPREIAEPGFNPKSAPIRSVTADMTFAAGLLPEIGEAKERVFTLYAGPKQYSELRAFDHHQVKVMEFGMWTPLCNFMLWALTALYRLIPNYGVAIILLTVLIRIVFWPLTHKSGQSMRKMQELAPELAKIKASIKDPRKQQQATLELYKKHKVNPVSGCLPMLLQFPFMIALFYVLRSAIELRYASFLWIRDLSEPENLLPGILPFGYGLNLLPLIMTGVQILQQKLTPSTGDPAQQKIMTFMPIMMLFLFYNFASGLVLYWTVSQGVMVIQMTMQRRKATHKPA